ncbi:hypothetical protein IWX47DRAFT_889909 [Phyllosticta citricarpa]|uniref:NAD(P)-binding protein n=1 Tax=Phyllosticta citricarpa TaxID=55181 RepID=A0ABR1MGF4_9PEZI
MSQSTPLPALLPLRNKTAIVTGASRGIGSEMALSLARRGAHVALVHTSPSSRALAEAVAAEVARLDNGARACVVQADMAARDAGEKTVEGALRGLGVRTVEIVVLNAAVGEMGDVEGAEGAEKVGDMFDRIFHTNVLGPHLVVRAVLPYLNPEGSNRLISISSVNARIHAPRWAFYSASKNALESLTRNWAKELAARYRLTANSVVVGPTETERATSDPRGRAVAAGLATADKRIATKGDVADVVCWLAGEESRWVNGDAIGCHGGAVFGY